MKRRAILVHGWEGYPDEGWRPWLKGELEQRGFEVIIPAMPETATPTLETWLSFLTQIVGNPHEYTYFVGHSLGCITILRYLETLGDRQLVGGVVLVAGFGHDLEYESYKGELSSFFKAPLEWEKIKKHSKKFVAIHSTDDPYVSLKHNKLFQEKLGANSIIAEKMKHFSGSDGITKLPIVLRELLEMDNKN